MSTGNTYSHAEHEPLKAAACRVDRVFPDAIRVARHRTIENVNEDSVSTPGVPHPSNWQPWSNPALTTFSTHSSSMASDIFVA